MRGFKNSILFAKQKQHFIDIYYTPVHWIMRDPDTVIDINNYKIPWVWKNLNWNEFKNLPIDKQYNISEKEIADPNLLIKIYNQITSTKSASDYYRLLRGEEDAIVETDITKEFDNDIEYIKISITVPVMWFDEQDCYDLDKAFANCGYYRTQEFIADRKSRQLLLRYEASFKK